METALSSQVVNGVDVDQLMQTIEAIRDNPAIASFRFKSSNEWIGGGNNRTSVNEYSGACAEHARTRPFVIEKDEPPVLLGTDRGANPVEYLLAALAGCLTTSLVYHAAARGIELRSVRSRYEGDLDLHGFLGLDENVRNGYQQIRVVFDVDADASDEEIRELVALAQRRSPVFDIVSNPVPVRVEASR